MKIVSPFFGTFKKEMKIYPKLIIENVFFPASKIYPPTSKFAKFMELVSLPFYSGQAVIKILLFKKNGSNLVLISDFVSGFLPTIVAKVLNLRIICYEGNLTPWVDPKLIPTNTSLPELFLNAFITILAKTTSNFYDAIVVNDGLIKNGLSKSGVPNSRIFVIRGMVDINKFKPSQLEKPYCGEFLIAFNGRLNEEKGGSFLLSLCKAAIDELPDAQFVVLGDGSYKQRLSELPNIRHIGQVEHQKICELLSSVDVVVSFQKTFGMGEIEALACGKPIIASKVGEMPTLLRDGDIGIVCEPDVSSYIEAIKILIKNDKLLKKLSNNARERAIRSFDSKIASNQWKLIVDAVMCGSVKHD